MKIKFRGCLALLMGLLGCNILWAQEEPSHADSILWQFRQQFEIDSATMHKNVHLQRLAQAVDSVLHVDSVTFADITGYASIDGPVALNRRLAKERAKVVYNWLVKSTEIDPSITTIHSNGEDWQMFRGIVADDPDFPQKAKTLEIIDSKLGIMQKQARLRSLDNGRVWAYMAKKTFPEMRMTEVAIGGAHKFVVKDEEILQPEIVEQTVEVVEVVEEPTPEPIEYWTRKMYVKTNAPAWLMLWINAAWEVDMAPHWSFNLPIYYSGFNYFTSKLKFRTFSVVPEFRYWPREDNMGFFVNAHLGMNLFNYAKGGEWRYQTYKGHTPALGGGVGIGYRWYFCKNHRWSMEAAVGAGVYRLDYSIFENIHNGLIVGRRKRTFFGVDQAALSFVYSFGVQRKEVKK